MYLKDARRLSPPGTNALGKGYLGNPPQQVVQANTSGKLHYLLDKKGKRKLGQ